MKQLSVFLFFVIIFLIFVFGDKYQKSFLDKERKEEIKILKELKSEIEYSVPDSILKKQDSLFQFKMYSGDDSDSLEYIKNYLELYYPTYLKLDSLILEKEKEL